MNDAVTDTHGLIWYLENSPRLGEKGETGLVVVDLTVEVVKALSKVPRKVVPELPDRIIAATALYLGLPLISRDRAIQQASIEVVW